jgi:hypothetical protein
MSKSISFQRLVATAKTFHVWRTARRIASFMMLSTSKIEEVLQKNSRATTFRSISGFLCHPWFTTTNLSYRFPMFETSTTPLCGTSGNSIHIYIAICIHTGWLCFASDAVSSSRISGQHVLLLGLTITSVAIRCYAIFKQFHVVCRNTSTVIS